MPLLLDFISNTSKDTEKFKNDFLEITKEK